MPAKLSSTTQTFACVVLLVLLNGCAVDTSVMNPAGPAAAHLNRIWWIFLLMALAVYGFVMMLLAIALLHRRSADEVQDPDENPDTGAMMGNTTFVLLNGVAMPLTILLVVFVVTMRGMQAISLPRDAMPLSIEVWGHQYWWEVRYPDYNLITANEIHIPVNEPVRVVLYTDDVIHTFWVPELQGKTDMIPGQRNETWIEASEVGRYYGICAEFCGLQHAKMRFIVVAETQDDFEEWVESQQEAAPAPQDDLVQQGWMVFQDAGRCAECHAVRGTNATGDLGPDLTHFASRLTLGAGAVPNTRGHLSGWVIDAQSIKPGALMPPIDLASNDLQALLAYLETLE